MAPTGGDIGQAQDDILRQLRDSGVQEGVTLPLGCKLYAMDGFRSFFRVRQIILDAEDLAGLFLVVVVNYYVYLDVRALNITLFKKH